MASAGGSGGETLQNKDHLHPRSPDTWPLQEVKVLLQQRQVDITNQQQRVGRTEGTTGDMTRSVEQILRPKGMKIV